MYPLGTRTNRVRLTITLGTIKSLPPPIWKGDAPQRGADPKRVELAERQFDCVYCELEPGDAIFFHSNLLHTSDQNRSKTRRWSMIIAYNRSDNDPIFEHHHPVSIKIRDANVSSVDIILFHLLYGLFQRYHKLEKVDDEELMRCNRNESTTEKWYFRPDVQKKNWLTNRVRLYTFYYLSLYQNWGKLHEQSIYGRYAMKYYSMLLASLNSWAYSIKGLLTIQNYSANLRLRSTIYFSIISHM